VALAEHSDSRLRSQRNASSRFENLSDVGSFQPPHSNKPAELNYPKGPQRYRVRDSSPFVAVLSSERNVKVTGLVRSIIPPPVPRLPLGDTSGLCSPHAPVIPYAPVIWNRLAVGIFDCSSETEFGKPQEEITPHITEDAQKRLRGHEGLFHKLLFITRQEAAARRVSLRKIDALGAWSHEYENNNGVVIHVEVQGSDEERFSVWEGISERINLLHDTLFAEEREFLTSEISVIVDRQ
jgi:hypothetical protein